VKKGKYIKKGYNLNSAFKKGCKPTSGSFKMGHKSGMFGKQHTEAAKRKMRESAHRGEDHFNWKGGISGLKNRIRQLSEFKQWRSDVFQRDNWVCQTCGIRSRKGKKIRLEAHHRKSLVQIITDNYITNIVEAQMCKELWDTDNGVTLCKECHKLTRNYGVNKK